MKKNVVSLLVVSVFLIVSQCATFAACRAESDELFRIFKHAVVTGDDKTIEQLVGEGCDLDIQSSETGWTPVHLIAMQGTVEMAKALHVGGANFKALDAKGKTPMDYAKREEMQDCIAEILGIPSPNKNKKPVAPKKNKDGTEFFGGDFEAMRDAYREYTNDYGDSTDSDAESSEEPVQTIEVTNDGESMGWYEYLFGVAKVAHASKEDVANFANAVVAGDLVAVRKLLKAGTAQYQKELLGKDPHHMLTLILERNKGAHRLAILEELLNAGLDFDAKTPGGFTYCSLHATKCTKEVKALFEKHRKLRASN